MSSLLTGSIAYDVLLGFQGNFPDSLQADSLDTLSVSYFSPDYKRAFGGSASNIAWHMALLGSHPVLVGGVGDDGEEYVDRLQSAGIDVTNIQVIENHVTATAIIGTDSGSRQIAFYHPGADSFAPWSDPADVSDVKYVLASPRDKQAMMDCIDWGHKEGKTSWFDPGQQVHMFSAEELSRMSSMSSGVIVNEYEWGIVSNTLNIIPQDFTEQFATSLIITRGENGAELHEKDCLPEMVPACMADQCLNPTGAGDSVRAGMLYSLEQGKSLREALQFGCALASFVVETDETQLEKIDKDALNERYEKTYG